ncbi:MAG: ABC transporter ATP-binding protein, partial [Calditrichia bacterium]
VGVQQISFSVERGEIFGFLGPNGAGKTTTIRLLLDLLRPSAGDIFIFGVKIASHSLAIRKRCGYLPGSFSAYKQMTGIEFLRFAANLRRVVPVLQTELFKRFELSADDLSRKIKHLSHGTLQKLGIVQAFFHRPELLILDEPTIGLDPLMQENFYELLYDFQKEGRTIFFSSHNLPEVEKVCHRVAIIRNSELVAMETLEHLKQKRFRRLILILKKPVENLQLNNARLVKKKGLHYEFLVKGDIQPLLQALANLPVQDLIFPEADLEEVFMTYYRKKSDE